MLNETVSYYSQTVQQYSPDIIKISLHIINHYTGNYGSLLLCILIGSLALWSMRQAQQETMRSISVSLIAMFIISLLFFAYGEFVDVHMYLIGILAGISLLFQKSTNN